MKPTWETPIWHRGYRIYFANTVFANTVLANYAYVHDDYDGAPDANDNRAGYGSSVEDCKAQIDDMEDENNG